MRNRFTGLVDLFTMTPGDFDVVFGATQCAAGAGAGLPPPRIGIALKGNAPMALYNLCESSEMGSFLERAKASWRVRDRH